MKSAKVLSIIAEKGGATKSSLTFNIAWYLSEQKKKVLIIDFDPQRANITYYANVKDFEGTILEGFKESVSVKSLVKDIKPNLQIIPGNNDLQGISNANKIKPFRDMINELKEDYDYIFIDVSPSPSWVHVLTLSVADYVLIPCLCDVASLEAVNGIYDSIGEIKDYSNPNLQVLGIVFSRNNPRTNLSKEVKRVAELMANKYNTKVFKTTVRDSVMIGQALAMHKGITSAYPKSPVANDIVELVKEMKKEMK